MRMGTFTMTNFINPYTTFCNYHRKVNKIWILQKRILRIGHLSSLKLCLKVALINLLHKILQNMEKSKNIFNEKEI